MWVKAPFSNIIIAKIRLGFSLTMLWLYAWTLCLTCLHIIYLRIMFLVLKTLHPRSEINSANVMDAWRTSGTNLEVLFSQLEWDTNGACHPAHPSSLRTRRNKFTLGWHFVTASYISICMCVCVRQFHHKLWVCTTSHGFEGLIQMEASKLSKPKLPQFCFLITVAWSTWIAYYARIYRGDTAFSFKQLLTPKQM